VNFQHQALTIGIFAVACIKFTEVAWVSPITVASPSLPAKECDQAITAAKSRLQKVDQIKLVGLIKSNISQPEDKSFLLNRSQDISFQLSGPGGTNVMNSKKIMKAISNELIAHCQSVASVSFGIARTDWSQTYGIMKNGTVQLFKCVDASRDTVNIKLAWGTRICL
jgi:hypothetical protein